MTRKSEDDDDHGRGGRGKTSEGSVLGEQERGGVESRKERVKRVAGVKDEEGKEGRESTHSYFIF
jgi:hypothetical protein